MVTETDTTVKVTVASVSTVTNRIVVEYSCQDRLNPNHDLAHAFSDDSFVSFLLRQYHCPQDDETWV